MITFEITFYCEVTIMSGKNLSNLLSSVLGVREPESEPEHVTTVKISKSTHARLRAIAELAGRSKSAFAAELLTVAIEDFIEALPNEPVDQATQDKILGVSKRYGKFEPESLGILDLVLRRAEDHLSLDEHERREEQSAVGDMPQAHKQNGVAH
jgi:hypothetical protein